MIGRLGADSGGDRRTAGSSERRPAAADNGRRAHIRGLRLGKLLWLTRQDVDLAQGYLRVRRKKILGRTWMPTTGKDRAVPISFTLRIWLEAYTPPAQVPWYFTTPNGYQWDSDAFGQALRKSNRPAGLKWTALDYWLTFGSHLAMKCESLYRISQLMGNNPEICRRHYDERMRALGWRIVGMA